MSAITWFRNSYGVIVNGIGWEIAKDADDCDCGDEYGHCVRFQMGEHFAPNTDGPWSLFHHGEYVGNYETVEAAKADADTSACSKCSDLS